MRRYHYFGIQFFGECWSGPNVQDTYDMYGEESSPKKCFPEFGVGGAFTNMVYQLPH